MTTEQKMFEEAFKSQLSINIGEELRKIYNSFILAGFSRRESMELLKTIIIAGRPNA